jgi:hypothetical protein
MLSVRRDTWSNDTIIDEPTGSPRAPSHLAYSVCTLVTGRCCTEKRHAPPMRAPLAERSRSITSSDEFPFVEDAACLEKVAAGKGAALIGDQIGHAGYGGT